MKYFKIQCHFAHLVSFCPVGPWHISRKFTIYLFYPDKFLFIHQISYDLFFWLFIHPEVLHLSFYSYIPVFHFFIIHHYKKLPFITAHFRSSLHICASLHDVTLKQALDWWT